jgi:SAM-dependent methyltransferase
MNKSIDAVKRYWDESYGVNSPLVIKKEDVEPSNKFEEDIKEFSEKANYILDYGCGITFNLYIAHFANPKLINALGIDPSKNAIDFSEGSARKSNFDNVHYEVGDIDALKKVESESRDFVICSNVLDCVFEETRNEIAPELYRVTKKNGIFLLKVNFFLNRKTALAFKMTPINDYDYAQNGSFRISFHEDDYWINLFTSLGFKLVRKDLFRRREGLPEDRIFIFKK